MSCVLDHLHDLYAHSDDPWNFAHSPYEQAKFAATRDALTRTHYHAALEIGCGNGALAQHLAPLCARYTGIDAVERAVAAARERVPGATFVQDVYPCDLPLVDADLVILSEFLYFLTPALIAQLGKELIVRARGAEVVCVTYLGETAQALQGWDTLQIFEEATRGDLNLAQVADHGSYRIDRGIIGEAAR